MFIEGYNTEIQCDSLLKLSINFILENKEEYNQVMEELQTGNSYFELKSRQQSKSVKNVIYNPYFDGDFIEKDKNIYNKFATEYKAEFMEQNTTPHSERVKFDYYNLDQKVSIAGSDLNGKLLVEDEENTLTVEMAGVDPDRIEIKKIDNILRIRVNPEVSNELNPIHLKTRIRELNIILTDRETVENVDLDLGMLTVTINRGRDVEEFNIG